MKLSELLLKALEFDESSAISENKKRSLNEFFGIDKETGQDVKHRFENGAEWESSRILAILRGSGVLDVLDAAAKTERILTAEYGHLIYLRNFKSLAEAIAKLRERLGDK